MLIFYTQTHFFLANDGYLSDNYPLFNDTVYFTYFYFLVILADAFIQATNK